MTLAFFASLWIDLQLTLFLRNTFIPTWCTLPSSLKQPTLHAQPLDLTNILLTQTSHVDYEELCCPQVLALPDTHSKDQSSVYAEFKEKLVRHKEGWYKTGLPWQGHHHLLPNNKDRSLQRLASLNKELDCRELTNQYAEIIEYQKKEGVVKRGDESCISCQVNQTCPESHSRVNKTAKCLTRQQEPSVTLHH